jgi:oligopeptidase B
MELPRAKRMPKRTITHGVARVDDYAWLRERESPDVRAYLEAENAYAASVMADARKSEESLFAEMKARIPEDEESAPYLDGEYYYYARISAGQEYAVHCRKRGSLAAPEEVLLDENELAKGHDFLSVGFAEASPNHKLLAYALDTMGDERHIIYVKNLETGELFPETLPDADVSFEWANDNRTCYYTAQDALGRPSRVLRHVLGTDAGSDVLVCEETDERFALTLSKSRSQKFIFVQSASTITKEVQMLDADVPLSAPRIVEPRRDGHEYSVDHRGGFFYVLTNADAPNCRLMRTSVDRPAQEYWEEVIAHREEVQLDGFDVFADFIALYEIENATQHLRIFEPEGGHDYRVAFPETAYAIGPGDNTLFQTRMYRFAYSSPITPATVFDLDVATRALTVVKEEEVCGGYDKTKYVVERIDVPAEGGALVPLTLVYKKGARTAVNPAWLYAYGAYGLTIFPGFSYERLSLLERGFVYAIAHVRGGGERGRAWYEDGKYLHKKNTFTDVIACAEYLVRERYCHKKRLVLSGRSAGGLMVGAVLNLRPDLFAAAVAGVPFVDVVNTMLDPNIPLTVGEYEEWGNPSDEAYFDYMLSYSPYDNIEAKAYPPLLVLAGLNDARVQYFEPAKWVAKLRATKTDDAVLLLKTELDSGHFGASGRYESLKETAYEIAFVLMVLSKT